MIVTREIQSIRSKFCPTALLSTTDIHKRTVVMAMCVRCRDIHTTVRKVGHFVQKGTMTQTHRHCDFSHYSPGHMNDETRLQHARKQYTVYHNLLEHHRAQWLRIKGKQINNTFRYVGNGGYRCARWNLKL